MSRTSPSLSARSRGLSLLFLFLSNDSRPAPAGNRPASMKSWLHPLRRTLLLSGVFALATLAAQAQNFAPVTVGLSSSQVITATVSSATADHVVVVTQGATGLDFQQSAPPAPTTCAGTSCSVSVTFAPKYAGLRSGAILVYDSGNSLLGTTYISGIGMGGLGVLIPGTISTYAGNSNFQTFIDNVPATSATLFLPASVALDGQGNLYIADSKNNRIRMVCAGTTTTIAGTSCTTANNMYTIAGLSGTGSYAGDGLVAATNSGVTLDLPTGVAIDGAGNLYIADRANNVIRKITAATGVISTVAGNHSAGYSGDGFAATSASLNAPEGVAVDMQGNLFIADRDNNAVREVNTSGVITTVAGTGIAGSSGDNGAAINARLSAPYAVALDTTGNLYIADTGNDRVRAICGAPGNTIFGVACTAGNIQTVAGNGSAGFLGDGGLATSAELNSPSGVAVDPAGNIYISDTQNYRIRKVNTTGIISTSAGNGSQGSSGDVAPPPSLTGRATYAEVDGPYGLTIDGSGNLFVAEILGNKIREIAANESIVPYQLPVRQGTLSSIQDVSLENDGYGSSLTVGTIAPSATPSNAAFDNTSSTCVRTPTLGVGSQCIIGAQFAPAATPALTVNTFESGDIDVPVSPIPTQPLDIHVVGTASPVNSTTTTITSSLNPANYGQDIVFSVTVATGPGTGALTGTVTIYDNTSSPPLASNLPLTAGTASGVATLHTSTLPSPLLAGTHTIWACYVPGSADPNHFGSCSTDNGQPALAQVIYEKVGVSLSSSSNPSLIGLPVTLTANVSAGGGGITPSGAVTFTDTIAGSTTVLGSGPITLSAGVAAITISTLPDGPNVITAVYTDNSLQVVSDPVSLTQIVQAPSTTSIVSNNPSAIFGQPVTFTITVTTQVPGTPVATGQVDIYDGLTKVGTATQTTPGQWTYTTTSLAVGSHTITAKYLGDNYNAPSAGSTSQSESITQTATSVAASPVPGIAGKAVVLTATIKVIQGASTVTGTVTFMDGTTVLGTARVGAGTATLTPILAPGAHAIVATYSGDSNDSGSTSSALPLSVILATTSTTIASSGSPSYVLAPITLTATVTGNGGTPTGSVTFYFDGASIGSATLNGSAVATFTYTPQVVGTHNLTATYTGDTNDNPSSSGPLAQVIQPIPTTTSLGETTAGGPPPQAILVATVIGPAGPIPTGTVTFFNGTNVVGQSTIDSTGVATLVPDLPQGKYSITASYSGDAIHAPSTSAAFSYTSTPIDFNVSVSPPTVSVATKQNVTVTLTISSIEGYADSIGVGCLSLPAAVNCHFSSDTVNLTAGSTQTVQLTIDTNNPLGGGSSAKNTAPGKKNLVLAGLFFPVSLIFGLVLWRFRKAHSLALFGAVVFFLASAFFVTGCGAFSQASATPGTYTIQVGGVGKNSNVSHYQSVTLTITK